MAHSCGWKRSTSLPVRDPLVNPFLDSHRAETALVSVLPTRSTKNELIECGGSADPSAIARRTLLQEQIFEQLAQGYDKHYLFEQDHGGRLQDTGLLNMLSD